MAISKEEVQNIAHLSRLELSEEEIATFGAQLGEILGFVEKLSEVDVEGVEPFINAAAAGDNVLRDDRQLPSLPNEEATANAAERTDGFFKVPGVID